MLAVHVLFTVVHAVAKISIDEKPKTKAGTKEGQKAPAIEHMYGHNRQHKHKESLGCKAKPIDALFSVCTL